MNTVLKVNISEAVATITIARPEAKNALNSELRKQLADEFIRLRDNDAVKVIILTGTGDAFVAGADLKEIGEMDSVDIMLKRNHIYWQAISDCRKPLIAAVNGYAFGGGCELAMHADIIIAGQSASFCQPEIKVGLIPGAGGTQRLTRAVGKYKAMRLLLTGDVISAEDAFDMGLVSEVVADDELLAHATKIATKITRMPPLAVEQIKEVVNAGQDCQLETALMLERKAFQLLFSSQDKNEGVTAFMEKRHPKYSGR